MIYLASPYSHPEASVREARYNAARLCAAACLKIGQPVFSPIAYGHPLNEVEPALGTSAQAWKEFNTAMLRHASMMSVLMLEGWDQSAGVTAEIAMAKALDIPVYYIEYFPPSKGQQN
jgi:nucleoside 2-deoxyribosyltransferase